MYLSMYLCVSVCNLIFIYIPFKVEINYLVFRSSCSCSYFVTKNNCIFLSIFF